MARSESESGGSVATLHATGGTIEIPDAQLLFTATFLKSGQDLILLGADGSKLIIVGYFAGEELALLLAPNGASLMGETVRLLAGPEFPGQYAQAGGPAGAEPIGQVETASGTVTVQRANGVILQLKVGDPVFEDDIVITGQISAVGISFTDETLFSLLADTRMVLDKHVYDPNGSSNSMLFDVIQGTFSVVAGKIAPTGDMLVRTPIATIGVRGTEYGGKNLVQADGAEGKLFVLTGTINILNNLTLQVIQTVSDPSVVIAGAGDGNVDIQPPSGSDVVQIQQIATQLQGVKSQFQTRKEQQGDTDPGTPPNTDGDPGAAPGGPDQKGNAPKLGDPAADFAAITLELAPEGVPAETTTEAVSSVSDAGVAGDGEPAAESDINDGLPAPDPQPETGDPAPVVVPNPPQVTQGPDFIVGSSGPDVIDALGGNDIISGNAGNDILSGGAGNDIVDGGVGDDVITGGTGDDTLTGGDGNDTISGNEGNDTIILGFGAGNDTADGGPDNDTAIYTSTVNGVIVNLETGEARSVIPDDPSTPENESEIDTDTLIDIENVVGGSGNDIITGTGGANILAGLDGNDRLDGNGGADILSGGTGDDTLVISEDAAFVLDGGEGTDTVLFAGALNLNTQETTGDATSIEIIDLNTTDTNRFELAAEDVEVISGATPLRILGGPTQGGSETDTVVLNATFDGVPDGVWQQVAADVVIDGVLFDTYQFVEGSTAFATVHIAQGINVKAPPQALPDDEATDEDNAVIIDVLANDDDPDGSNANMFVASFDATGVQGTVTLNANDTFTYDPGAAFQGLAAGEQVVETFTYVLEDEQGLQDVGTATVTITGVNDPAVIGGVSTGDVTEDDDPATLATGGLLTITDVDAGEAEFVAQAATAGNNGFGTFTLDTAGNWTYTAVNAQLAIQSLADGDTLTDSFTAVSSDGSASQLVTVTITGLNDTAVIGGVSTGDVTEDDDPATLATGGLLTITDVDAGEAEFAAQAATAGSNGFGTFTLDTAGNWTYSAVNTQLAIQSLADGDTLTDSFTAVSSDGSASQLVTVTITGLNDTAVIGGVSTGDVTEDDDPATLATGGLLTITDVDAGEAEFAAQASTAGSNGFGTFTLDTAGNWTYAAVNTQLAIQSLADGDTLTDSFTAVSSDGSASQLVTVTITGLNDTAVIGGVSTGDVTEDDDPATLATGGLLTITDVDAGEAEFAAQASTAGSNGFGTFTLDTAGNWTYAAVNTQLAIQSLADGETITDSFTAVSADGSASQLVTVTITGTNDAPEVAVNTAAGDSAEDTLIETNAGLTSTGTLTVTDVDTTDVVSASVQSIVTSGDDNNRALPSNATLLSFLSILQAIVVDGTETEDQLDWSFDSGTEAFDFLADGQSLTLTYTVEVADGTATAQQTVAITITGTDEAPIIGTPGDDILLGTTGDDTIDGLAGNDTINGGFGNDTIDGGLGNDILNGGGDKDTLIGGFGFNRLEGGDGDDTLIGGIRGTNIDGNRANYGDATDQLVQSTGLGAAAAGSPTTDEIVFSSGHNLVNGEKVTYVAGAGVIGGLTDGVDYFVIVDPVTDVVRLAASRADALADTPVAIDLISAGSGGALETSNGIRVTLTGALASDPADILSRGTVLGGPSIGTDSLINIDQVFGTDFDDVFVVEDSFLSQYTRGTSRFNEIDPGAGDDIVVGNGATRIGYVNITGFTADGGDGIVDGVTVDMAAGEATATNAVDAALVGFDVFTGVNSVRGSNFADEITGRDSAGDSIRAQGGNDFIDGGDGGGDRTDYRNSPNGVVVNLSVNADGTTDDSGDTPADGDGVALDGFGRSAIATVNTGTDQIGFASAHNFVTGQNVTYAAAIVGGTLIAGLTDFTTYFVIVDDATTVRLAATQADALVGNAIDLTSIGSGGTLGVSADTFVGIENVRGSEFDDVITGDAGNNFLDARDGEDDVFGLGGNDTLRGGVGDDLLDGGGGRDRVDYRFEPSNGDRDGNQSTNGVSVDLSNDVATDSFGGTDTLVSIEDASGTDFDDTIIGNGLDNFLRGNAGDDDLFGGGGNDNLVGDAGIDDLFGGDGFDFLQPGSGDDTVDGGAGVDDFDSVSYRFSNLNLVSGFTYTGGTGLNGIAVGSAEISGNATIGFDTLIEVEGVQGTDFVDTFNGGDANESLNGFGGEDIINGGAGDDFLDGGDDNDTIDGGIGNDNLLGGAGIDDLSGGEGFDFLRPGSGDDTVDGGAGTDDFDTVSYRFDNLNLTSGFTYTGGTGLNGIAVGSGEISGNATIGFDTLTEVEGIEGTDFVDVFNGGDANETLNGFDGGDQLFGGAGSDFIAPGAGNDTVDGGDDFDNVSYAFSDATDGITYTGGTGANGIAVGDAEVTGNASIGTDTLTNVEAVQGTDFIDVFTGGDAGENFAGFDGNDVFDGGEGGDIFQPGAGNDSIDGGIDVAGDDFDFVQYGFAGAPSVGITYTGGTGANGIPIGEAEVVVPSFGTDTLVNIEGVQGTSFVDVFNGGDAGENLNGADGNDDINGGAGDDFLFGDDGDDILAGGLNDDVLSGGLGLDELTGGAGADDFEFVNGTLDADDLIFDFDVTEIDAILLNVQAAAEVGSDANTDSVDDFLRVFDEGAAGRGLVLQADVDGAAGPAGFETIADFVDEANLGAGIQVTVIDDDGSNVSGNIVV